MDFQDAARLTIPEGEVRNIHDTDSRLLWSAVGYDVDYEGDTEQTSYTGKNLFNNYDTNYIATNTNPGTITFTTLPTGLKMDYPYPGTPWALFKVGDMRNYKGKTIRLSMSFTSGATNYRLLQLSEDGTNRNLLATSTTSGETISFTIPANFDDTDMPYFGVRVTATAQSSVEFTNLILTVDNEDMTYEPYVGGQPSPSPDYPQKIHTVTGVHSVRVSGKNKIDVPDGTHTANGIAWTIDNGTIRGTGTLSGWTYSSIIGRADLNLPAGTYTFSFSNPLPSPLQLEFSTRDNEGTRRNYQIPVGETSMTKDFPNGLVWTGVAAVHGVIGDSYDVTLKNLQIEVGATPTAYEAPQSATYTINLGTTELCKIGNYQDYIYKGSDGWYVHKEIRKRILDGTETWGTSTYHGVRFFYLDTTDGLTSSNSQVVVLSDLFLGQWGGANNTIVFSANSATPRRMMIFTNDIGTTTSEWKTWLGSNNVLTYYALETPTDTKITDSTLVSQLDAVHNRITRYDYQYTISGNLPIIINRTGLT